MKKILSCVVLTMLMVFTLGFVSSGYTLVNLKKTDGSNSNLTFRNSSTVVKIPDRYELQGTDFRGAWVSTFVSDIAQYSSETQWKAEVASVLEVFKHYNLNAMIFHVRTHNNAMYDSDLNPIASWWTKVNFDTFDPLTYLIDECHKAGIEFHAWMNPYRISTLTSDINTAVANGQYLGEALPAVNVANDPANLIAGSSGVILNPGLPHVRDFIVDTCMEVVEKYDVDAIHFDDYFYISGAEDSATRAQYNTQGLSLDNWRRQQVDLFIEQLHDEMTAFNKANNKAVQIGISPSGIYKNGNGSVESGSNTSGFAHYGSYLYSDTYKWAKEGWIDYLLPQSYWAFEHKTAGYADVMSWWDKAFAVEGIDCLLYSGIGYYMADSESNTYSWQTNMKELANQLTYLTSLENVDGYSLYSYKYMESAYHGGTAASAQQVNNAESAGCFSDVALVPEIETMEPIILGKVQNVKQTSNRITWDSIENAKAYVVYRSSGEITYDESEIVAIVGTTSWTAPSSTKYNYDVCPLSRTNTVGGNAYVAKLPEMLDKINVPSKASNDFNLPKVNGVTWSLKTTTDVVTLSGNSVIINNPEEDTNVVFVATLDLNGIVATKEFNVTIQTKGKASFTLETDTSTSYIIGTEVEENGGEVNGRTIQVGYNRCLYLGSDAPHSYRQQYNLTSSNPDVATIDAFGTITAVSKGKTVIRAEYKADTSKWSEMTIYVYETKGTLHTVVFQGEDGSTLSTQMVFSGEAAIAPKAPSKDGYVFNGWDKAFTNVTSDLTIKATYKLADVEYLPGDLNNDGLIDTNDVIYLLMHTYFSDEYVVEQNCDYNNDTVVDTNDVIYLLMHTYFKEEYPLV